MKKSEIQVGRKYTDGKGNVREVTAEGRQFSLFSSQEDSDCLQYKLIAKKRGPFLVGTLCNCTRTAFAAWAKKEVE